MAEWGWPRLAALWVVLEGALGHGREQAEREAVGSISVVSGPQAVPLPSPAHHPAGQGPCSRPVGQRGGSSRWRGDMGAAPGSDKGGRTQGPEGHERCLRKDDARVTLPQIISTATLPSLGMCLDGTVGLCCRSSPGLAKGTGLGEHSGVPSPAAFPWASPVSVHRLQESSGALPRGRV